MPTRPKDSQRGRLYAAEREAFKAFPGLADVASPARYERRVREIMASKWMADTYPDAVRHGEVGVEFSAAMGGANANFRRIRTGPHSMNEWMLVHELAHVVHQRLPGSQQYDRAGHGRQYAEIYVTIARRFLGSDAYKALRESFRKHRVKVGPKRVRTVKASVVCAAAMAGLAAARAKRTAGAALKFVDACRANGVEKKCGDWTVSAYQMDGRLTLHAHYRWDWTAGARPQRVLLTSEPLDVWAEWKAWCEEFATR